MKPKPKKIRVDLLPEDFDRVHFKEQFDKAYDCPLAKALRRKFKIYLRVEDTGDKTTTGSITESFFGDTIYRFFSRDWNYEIANNVRQCYLQGDKTIYYVELERV